MTNEYSQLEPAENDVLCGRGGATNCHEGNVRFRAVIADHQKEYLEAKKRDKAGIARQIVEIIQSRGGRFLRKNDSTGLWETITNQKATEKTSQGLREGLDVRNKTIKRARGDNSTEETQPNKRPKVVTWSDYQYRLKQLYHSPVRSDSGEAPDLHEEVQRAMPPYFLHMMAPVQRVDCNDVATV
jgi:hypothetical protein